MEMEPALALHTYIVNKDLVTWHLQGSHIPELHGPPTTRSHVGLSRKTSQCLNPHAQNSSYSMTHNLHTPMRRVFLQELQYLLHVSTENVGDSVLMGLTI